MRLYIVGSEARKSVIKLAYVLSAASGFALMRHQAPPLNTIVTSIAIDLALAPLTILIASRRGRSRTLWTAAGLAFGMWALAAVLLMGEPAEKSSPRNEAPRFPTPPDAA